MRVPAQRRSFQAFGGVLTAAALLVVGSGPHGAGAARAGGCTDKDATATSCADPAAVYQVLTTVPGRDAACPHGDYFAHAGSAGTLCLGYNVAAADCIQDDPAGPARVACRPEVSTPTFQVLDVVENRATAEACRSAPGERAVALTYSVPAKTLCILHLPLDASA
jgi:hypothetical protein